jgi:iron complex transport system substrate-binding protein
MINTPYRDAWVLPSENNYMARIISDAGGCCYTTEGKGNTSKPIDIEQALLYAESADFWLNVGSCHTLQELTSQNPRFAKVKVVEDKKVYNNTARSTAPIGSDFWESGVVRPDIILKDLAMIFHPEIIAQEHTLYYYTRLN